MSQRCLSGAVAGLVPACLLALLLLTGLSHAAPPPATDLRSTLLGPADLPWDMILWDLRTGGAATRVRFASLAGPAAIDQVWFGEPAAPGRAASSSVWLTLAVAPTPQTAVAAAKAQVMAAAVWIPEVSGPQSPLPRADRCWYYQSPWEVGLTFTRGTVAVQLNVSSRGKLDPARAVKLAELVLKRIEAWGAGRPLPAPPLPRSAAEMKADLDGAWAKHRRGEDRRP